MNIALLFATLFGISLSANIAFVIATIIVFRAVVEVAEKNKKPYPHEEVE